MENKKNNRFWELDLLRGIAIILMIIFHFLFVIIYFSVFNFEFNLFTGLILPRIVQIIFITLVGICSYISYDRNKIMSLTNNELTKKFVLRGVKVFTLGLLLTIITYLLIPSTPDVFGILHFIGVSIILGYFCLQINKNYLFLIFAAIIFILTPIVQSIHIGNNYLMVLGIISNNFNYIDYFPLFPWFGLILLGIYLGKILYRENKRNYKLKDLSNIRYVQLLCYLGRHALFIYFIQYPLIILIALLTKKILFML